MTDYAAKLATLDTKMGRVHTIDDWNRVGQKAQHSLEALTDDDLTIIGYFAGPEHAARVTERRRLALNPPPVPTPVPQAKRQPSREARIKRQEAYAEAICQVIKSAIHSVVGGPAVKGRLDQLEAKLVALAEQPKTVVIRRESEATTGAGSGTLEKRLTALEARPEVAYHGVHVDGASYLPGALITKTGGLWLAEEATSRTPGRPGSGWRLIVKSGGA